MNHEHTCPACSEIYDCDVTDCTGDLEVYCRDCHVIAENWSHETK